MELKAFQTYSDKYGFLTEGIKVVEGGISKKTGKPFDTFATIKILEYGATDSVTIYVSLEKLTLFENVTTNMPYLQGVVVSGSSTPSGRFTATAIEPYDFSAALE